LPRPGNCRHSMSQRVSTKLSLRDKLLLLATVNTFQPVQWGQLLETLAPDLSAKRLRAGLATLRGEGMVGRIGSHGYVVTQAGRQAFGTGALARQRDVERLLYLFRQSKGGGGTA